jgi:hypothetical protein
VILSSVCAYRTAAFEPVGAMNVESSFGLHLGKTVCNIYFECPLNVGDAGKVRWAAQREKSCAARKLNQISLRTLQMCFESRTMIL